MVPWACWDRQDRGHRAVIHHLRESMTSPNTAVAFVYCDEERPEQTSLALLSSICSQLTAQSATLPAILEKLYWQMKANNQRPDIDNIMLAIMALCDAFEKIIICVDGLDECLGGIATGFRPKAAVDVAPGGPNLCHESNTWRLTRALRLQQRHRDRYEAERKVSVLAWAG